MSDFPEIEVFKVGKLQDSAGRVHEISAGDLDEIVAAHEPSQRIPLVHGHPKDDQPAVGFVAGLRRVGEKLIAKVMPSQKLIDGVRDRQWLKVSVALWPRDHLSSPAPGKLALRHVGILGAAAPAVPGLAPLDFGAALAFAAAADQLPTVDPMSSRAGVDRAVSALRRSAAQRGQQIGVSEAIEFLMGEPGIDRQMVDAALFTASFDMTFAAQAAVETARAAAATKRRDDDLKKRFAEITSAARAEVDRAAGNGIPLDFTAVFERRANEAGLQL